MKLTKKNLVVVSFMLFSMFFGAGNLIFPPFLGQNAGSNAVIAIIGFLITAVLLPVLGVIVVAKFDGLDKLGMKVGKHFALIFTILIYLSIGPGLGIPRAASVPFEMAVLPYLPSGSNTTLFMILYSFIFFALVLWLCLTPQKLVKRIGHILTPCLLFLILVLFVGFIFKGEINISDPQPDYNQNPFLKGFTEGYQTMDTIAALNFGLVISLTLNSFEIASKNDKVKQTIVAGICAGIILTVIYVMLAYMGMCSSGVYGIHENGAWTLRAIVEQVFGKPGAILLAAIFTLAFLTTCVGLVNSISQFFSILFKKVSYTKWVIIITILAFFICNLGLSLILKISVPILNAIYPVAIVLIILGLSNKLWENNKYVYKLTIIPIIIVSIIYAFDCAKVKLGFLTTLCEYLPFYSLGFGWLSVMVIMVIVSLIIDFVFKRIKNNLENCEKIN